MVQEARFISWHINCYRGIGSEVYLFIKFSMIGIGCEYEVYDIDGIENHIFYIQIF